MITLITFMLFVFYGSILINGFYEITRKDKIFGFWERYWEDKAATIREPLSQCVMCMSSLYGSLIFWIAFLNHCIGFSGIQLILLWITYCLSLVPFTYFIHKKLN